MKRIILRLLGLFFCVSMGWALGYIRFPYIETSRLFWIGFMACLGVIAFGFSIVFILKNRTLFSFKRRPNDASQSGQVNGNKRVKKGSLWIALSLTTVVVFILVIGSIMDRDTSSGKEMAQIKEMIHSHELLIDSVLKTNQGALVSELLDQIDRELAQTSFRSLSGETLARIKAVNESLKPYRYVQGDSFSTYLSPERGVLVLTLAKLNLDSSTWATIKANTSFAQSDLSKADLAQADLSNIRLNNSNLDHSNLSGANLSYADLTETNLRSTIFDSANMQGCIMIRAKLLWTQMIATNLTSCLFDGARISNAKIVNSTMDKASLRWTLLENTLLTGTNLDQGSLYGTGVVKSNLTGTKITRVDMRLAEFNSSTFDKTVFDTTQVTIGILDRFERFKNVGFEMVKSEYEEKKLPVNNGTSADFFLVKKQ